MLCYPLRMDFVLCTAMVNILLGEPPPATGSILYELQFVIWRDDAIASPTTTRT